MSISRYFEDLNKAYRAELEDLQTDSEGKNVLAKRLSQKRSQFAELMPMIEFAPEMVAPVFHGAITFVEPKALLLLSFAEPEDFPAWAELAQAVRFEAWAQKLVAVALLEAGGERFLITMIGLEFLHAKATERSTVLRDTGADADEAGEAEEHGDGERADDGDEQDLDEAGADWMAEQGFDRRG